ncbi:MAG: hypothetical protein AAF629_09655 [Chloroflexota bacterium]
MKSRQKLIIFIMLFAAFSLACGLLGGGAEDEPAEPAAQAETATEDKDDKADSAEENVQNKVLQVGGGLTAPKVEITDSDDDEGDESAEASEDATDGDTEEAALEAIGLRAALDSFTSYRWILQAEFDGTDDAGNPEQGSVTMLLETTKEPSAFHMRMEMKGDAAAEFGGDAVIDTFAIGDTAYIKEPSGDAWISIPADGFADSFFSEGFLDPDDLFELPEKAQRNVTPEEVNGIMTWHYIFTEADLPEDAGPVESARGDLWVAQDGGYPVKMLLEATGIESTDNNNLLSAGNLKMSYELVDVNADFTIELPEEAANAESLGDFEMPATEDIDPASIPYPLMEDANIDFAMEGMVTYTSQSSVGDVAEFYNTSLSDAGWTEDATATFASDETSMLTFGKDGETINLIISKEEDGSTSVLLTSE